MVERLRYRAPQMVLAAVEDAYQACPRPLRVLDLGCGTGLMGAAIRHRAIRLDGVDISPAMVERARARGIYDRLDAGDLFALLVGRPGAYDLLLAADVCPYIGDLAPFLAACAPALVGGGLLAFTVERGESGWSLGGTRRFTHAPAHVRDAAASGGWRIVSLADAELRMEAERPVAGLVVLLAAP
jgi:predicted TPR repeat methyltransferase